MEKEDFETKLERMTIPDLKHYKHQDILERSIARAKDKSVLSWWWLIIPLYVISMLFMKSFFMPGATLTTSMHDLTATQKLVSWLYFFISPIVIIILNIISIRKVYTLSGRPGAIIFLRIVWLNVLMILMAVLVLIIFSL